MSDPSLPPAQYFRDYHWHHGIPAGDDPIESPRPGEGYFKFITPNLRPRVEQYDANGAFVRICYDPAERDKHARKIRWHEDNNHMGAVCLDTDGRVIRYEKYLFLSHDEPSLVRAEIYTADGRLIEIHTPARVGTDGQDIAVTDALGKLRVILHHRELSKGEPAKITEEWTE